MTGSSMAGANPVTVRRGSPAPALAPVDGSLFHIPDAMEPEVVVPVVLVPVPVGRAQVAGFIGHAGASCEDESSTADALTPRASPRGSRAAAAYYRRR